MASEWEVDVVTIDDERRLKSLQDALQGLSDCTLVMQENAMYVERELPNVRMSDENLARTRAVCQSLIAARGDVYRIYSELDGGTIATAADRAVLMETAYRAVSRIHQSLLELADLVPALDADVDKDVGSAAASILVVESAGNILRAYNQSKAACDEMQAAIRAWPHEVARTPDPGAAASLEYDLPAVGQAVTVLQVGAEGGDVTLFGRRRSDGEWQFARVTNDQSYALLGEVDVAVSPTPAIDSLKWVENWDEALQLMDRYPWARLHPVQVHPAFFERVRLAVDARLVRAPPDRFTEYAREKWDSLFRRIEASARPR
jgi:hypothetical protein